VGGAGRDGAPANAHAPGADTGPDGGAVMKNPKVPTTLTIQQWTRIAEADDGVD
jgi:hypothetical protein